MILVLQLTLLLVAGPHRTPAASCTAQATGQLVPTVFSGNRVFARWRLRGHGEVLLYTDTGGGLVSLFPEAARRLALPVDTIHWAQGGYSGTQMRVSVPRSLGDPLFPALPSLDSASVVLLVQYDQAAPQDEAGISWDGRLGSEWFADRVWILDYPDHRLYYNGTATVELPSPHCWIPVAFQTDSTGRRTNSFPRVTAQIDGELIEFLLDTGARTTLTDSAWVVAGRDEPRHRAASFIVRRRLDEWHARHPDWPYVLNAEEGVGMPMIRVPQAVVGNDTIGPVWFTGRADARFDQFMSQYMDQPVEGALGGSAWKYVRLVLDYPRARVAVLASTP